MTDDRKDLPSASKAPLLALCAGAWHLIRKAPPEKPSPYAESGQRVHDALKHRNPSPLREDELTVYEQCVRLESTWIEQCGFQNPDQFTERRIWLRDPKTGALLMSCRFDLALREQLAAGLADYKAGRVAVPHPRENWQIKSEVVMFYDCFDFDVCHTAILQPWVSPQLFTHSFYKDEFGRTREELILILKRAADLNAPRTPGRHCFHCPARGICPEGRSTVVEVLNCENAQLSGLQLSKDLNTFDAAESVIEARRLLAERILEASPSAVPGWVLDPAREPEHVEDAVEAFNLMAGYVSMNTFLSACRLSVAKLRKIYALRYNVSDAEAKAAVSEILAPVIKRQPRKPSLRRLNQ